MDTVKPLRFNIPDQLSMLPIHLIMPAYVCQTASDCSNRTPFLKCSFFLVGPKAQLFWKHPEDVCAEGCHMRIKWPTELLSLRDCYTIHFRASPAWQGTQQNSDKMSPWPQHETLKGFPLRTGLGVGKGLLIPYLNLHI